MNKFSTEGKQWLIVMFLCLSVAALYWRTLDYPPVGWDDELVEGSAVSRTEGFSVGYLKEVLLPHGLASYQPLRNISRDWLASISAPGNWHYYHLFNLIVYLLTLPLFFLTLKNIFGRLQPEEGADDFGWAAVIATALFALHPLHAEAVAWVAGQKDVLVGLFYILSIYFYTRSKNIGGWEVAGSIGCYFLALGSKPSAVSLALVVPAYDLFFRSHAYSRKNLSRQLTINLVYILPALLAGLFFIGTSAGASRINSTVNPLTRFIDIASAVSFMFEKFILPVNLVLRYPSFSEGGFFTGVTTGRIAVFIAAIYLAALSWKRKSPFAFFLVWALLALAPNANIIPIRIERADRYLYLSTMGLSASAAYLLAKTATLNVNSLRAVLVAVSSIVAVLSVLTFNQAGYWQNGISAWSRVVELYPGLTIGQIGYGKSLIRAGDYDKAVDLYEPLIEKQPPNAEALRDMAYIMIIRKNPEMAQKYLEQAARHDPKNDETKTMLTEVYLGRGLIDEAYKLALQFTEFNPGSTQAWEKLGRVLEVKGEHGQAASSFDKAYELSGEPEYLARAAYDSQLAGDTAAAITALNTLESSNALESGSLATRLLAASAFTALGMRDKAFELYAGMEFSELDPAGLEFFGALHFSKGSLELARKMFERVTRLNPALPSGWNNAGVAAEQAGDFAAADSFYRKALELAPGYLDANFNRGNLFRGRGMTDSALYYYQRADSIAAGTDQQVRRAIDEIKTGN